MARQHARHPQRRFAIVPLAASCLLVGCVALKPRRGRDFDLYERARRASVEILVAGRLEGSGWLAAADGVVVTAAHVLAGADDRIEVIHAGGQRLPAKALAFDWGHDIALLQIEGGAAPWPRLDVAEGMPPPGAPVLFYGSALFRHGIMLGGTAAQASTTFNYFADRGMPMRAYHITAPSPPGTSGGPWLDRSGRVVGNQSGFVTHRQSGAGIAIVAPPDAIRHLLRRRESVVRPSMDCGLEELWSQPKGFIQRFPEGTEGVITIPLQKKGAAKAAGLNRESLITAIDGRPVRYRDDVYNLVWQRQPGDLVALDVLPPENAAPRRVWLTLRRLGP